MKTLLLISSFFVALFAGACNNKSEQTGTNAPAGPSASPPANISGISPAPNTSCDPNAATTQATLKNTRIQNGKANQILTYEVKVTSCTGAAQSIADVRFDIDGEVTTLPTSSIPPLPYKILDQNNQLVNSGNLEAVPNADMFGKTGPKYFHHKTPGVLSLKANTSFIYFTVDVSNVTYHKFGTSTSGAAVPDQEIIPSYLKFGNATPVQQDITFVNRESAQ